MGKKIKQGEVGGLKKKKGMQQNHHGGRKRSKETAADRTHAHHGGERHSRGSSDGQAEPTLPFPVTSLGEEEHNSLLLPNARHQRRFRKSINLSPRHNARQESRTSERRLSGGRGEGAAHVTGRTLKERKKKKERKEGTRKVPKASRPCRGNELRPAGDGDAKGAVLGRGWVEGVMVLTHCSSLPAGLLQMPCARSFHERMPSLHRQVPHLYRTRDRVQFYTTVRDRAQARKNGNHGATLA
ncbi:hypothetical protein HPB51_017473 [Rhipicephalus microplus]|uniref:Uncharacterized protein n=1 Tax=Rhipicephalus microplus TaxID=6941 RepID=A0A9J6F5A0_RHIMP|nr:hypothetical protein HPB51_017473 [Rhipicephalus microplus]